jgi:homoserine O-acetyltransferase
MSLARKLGIVSYRSPVEWGLRLRRDLVDKPKAHGIEFEIEAYLEHQANRFVPTFDANSYLYLSRAMDLFDLEDHGDSLEHAFSKVGARRSLVVGVETDILFPVEQQHAMAEGLRAAGKNVHFARLSSLQGHDSFLIDLDRFSPVIGSFLQED